MKACVLTSYGSPNYLELRDESKPLPQDDEVLIKVQAVSINSWDWEILNGKPLINRMLAGWRKPTKIKILGCDIAGRVEAVGKNVTQFQPGDEVFGDISRCGWGGFAEYVCASENAVVLKPASMTFEQAAAVPQAGLLALQGLQKGNIQPEQINQGQISPGQKVLINGASGGVGSFAVQMAKSYRAEVTGVCRTSKMDFVRTLGADHIIDYTQQDFARYGQQYDLILDEQGHHSIFDYKRVLSSNGRYVMVGGSSKLVNQLFLLGPWISLIYGKKMGLLLHKPNANDLDMETLFESGKVTPVIDKHYPLSETAEAMRYFGEGHVKGKVVINIVESS